MNKLEASQGVEVIGSIYPNYHPMNLELAIDAWEGIFSGIPYDVVMGALYSYARDNKEFPPTPGQINAIIGQATGREEMTAQEAWGKVMKAVRNGYYGAEKEFARLPKEVQDAIGSPEYIRGISMMEDPNMDVEYSHFTKAYNAVLQRKRNIENLPENVRAIVEKEREGNIAQLEDKQSADIEAQRVFYTDALQVAERKALEESATKMKPTEEIHPMFRKFLDDAEEAEEPDDEYDFEEYTSDDDVVDEGIFA